MAFSEHHPITTRIAEECYERYPGDYASAHGVELAPWSALDLDVQLRWRRALTPVAGDLAEVEFLKERLERAERSLRRYQDCDESAVNRLAELGSTIRNAHRELPDMAALAALPPKFVQVVSSVREALEKAGPPN